MFNQIIELIKNSVVATTALLVGIFGIGSAPVANLPSQNSTVAPIEISQESSKDSGFFGSQMASIVQALPTEITGAVNVIAPASATVAIADNEMTTNPTTEYFDRVDIKPAVFERPLVETVVAPSVSETQTVTETMRPLNPIKSTKASATVDVSAILNINFDNFDLDLQITEITEDDKNFFVAYQFYTMAIKERTWQKIVKTKQMSISKTILKDATLENYLSEELGEVVDNEIVYLKEVQKIQRDKLLKEQQLLVENSRQVASEYSALIGKSLEFDAPAPAVAIKEIAPAPSAPAPVTVIEEIKTTSQGIIDNEAPTIIIQGNNPALVQLGSSYLDLGAKVTDNISSGLGVKTEGDTVNTSTKGSYFVDYIAVDEAGNVAKATREVIVYDYEKPAVQQINQAEQLAEQPPLTESVAETTSASVAENAEISVVATTTASNATTSATIVATDNLVATTMSEIQTIATTTTKKTTNEKVDVVVEKTIEAVGAVADSVNNSVNTAAGAMSDAAGATAEVVVGAVDVVVEAVADAVDATAKKAKEKTKETIEQVSETVEQVTEEIGAMIRAVHIMEMLGNIRSVLQASVVNVSSMLQSSLVGVSSGSQTIVGAIGGFISNTIQDASQVLQKINNFLEQKFKTLLENFENTGTILRAGVINIHFLLQSSVVGVADGSQTVLSSIGGFILNTTTNITDSSQIILSEIGESFANTATDATSSSQTVLSEIGGFISNTTADVAESSQNILSEIGRFISNTVTDVSDSSRGVVNEINEFISNTNQDTMNMLQKTNDFLFKKAKTFLEQMGYFKEEIINYTYQTIGRTADSSYKIAKYVWDKSNFGKALDSLSARMGATVSEYNREADEVQASASEYKQGSFSRFIFNEIKNFPQKIMKSVGKISFAMGASVKDFSHTIKSDLQNVGEQIEGADFERGDGILQRIKTQTKNTFSEIMNFFDNHRPH